MIEMEDVVTILMILTFVGALGSLVLFSIGFVLNLSVYGLDLWSVFTNSNVVIDIARGLGIVSVGALCLLFGMARSGKWKIKNRDTIDEPECNHSLGYDVEDIKEGEYVVITCLLCHEKTTYWYRKKEQ